MQRMDAVFGRAFGAAGLAVLQRVTQARLRDCRQLELGALLRELPEDGLLFPAADPGGNIAVAGCSAALAREIIALMTGGPAAGEDMREGFTALEAALVADFLETGLAELAAAAGTILQAGAARCCRPGRRNGIRSSCATGYPKASMIC